MAVSEFARLIRHHDRVDAFNEASRIALDDERDHRVRLVIEDGPDVVALAFAVGDAPVDMAVHPDHRRRGHGTTLLKTLLSQGERRFWAHGDLPAARGWAALLGLHRERTLLRLALRNPVPLPASPPSSGIEIRPYREEDLPDMLAVNARAFASHPEQRGMDRADFERRAAAGWFDPEGLFVAENRGRIVGFHWTKRESRIGEVYVLAVDPQVQGERIGANLLARGVDHLANTGVDVIELYVEEDNGRALDLYTSSGFAEVGRDVLYVSRTPAATVLGLS